MREHDIQSESFGNRLLSGWSRVFGKRRDNSSARDNHGLKPFPANHFFSQEELVFLSKNQEQCTLLQRWALQMSLWARSRSDERNRDNPDLFPAVQWQEGLMSTWIDTEAIPDDIDQQADRLYQLQLDGYEMSPEFVRMIEARACRSLVSNLFVMETPEDKDGKCSRTFIRVNSVVDKAGEALALSVYNYDKISHRHVSEGTSPYKRFRTLIEKKEIVALSKEAQRQWDEQATARDKAEQLFKDLVSLMKRSNTCQGMFPANNALVIHFGEGKDYVPVAWSLSDGKIKMDFDPRVSIERKSLFITADDSYLYVDILDFISKTISEQDYNRELLTFVRIFGKDFCGEKVFSSGIQPLCRINGVDIDRVTSKLSDTIVAFNNETLETVTLSPEDRLALLKAVIRHSDNLLAGLKTALKNSSDGAARESLLAKLDNIHQELSFYDTEGRYQSLDELWQHILSVYEVIPMAAGTQFTQMPVSRPEPAPQTVNNSHEDSLTQNHADHQGIKEPVDGSHGRPGMTNGDGGQMRKESPDRQTAVPVSEGYVRIGPSSKGRWHTPSMMRREAYRVYGRLLSNKLKKLLDGDPWVSKRMMLPRDTAGTVYTGSNAIMLALWTEEKGFELPFFITEDELRENNLGVLQNAESLFILTNDGASRVYNISQTAFQVTQRRSYESLKMNMVATERKKTSGYQFLDSESFCKIPLRFDGTPGLSVYSYTEKAIHIAPKDKFENEDDYYRDLAVAMVESTRDVDFDTLRLDTYLFENLVSHLGSGIISQSCRFNATNPEYSHIWRERLENNPEYTQSILEQSDIASVQILDMSLT